MSEREPTPAECEAFHHLFGCDVQPCGDAHQVYPWNHGSAIHAANIVLDLADRIRRERHKQEGK